MARRRSKKRQSKSNNDYPGILDENTNVFGTGDPLWANRTSVRPSASFNITQSASPLLSSNSDVNTTQLTDSWYENLSHSDTSKIIKSISEQRANISKEKTNVEEHASTDTESDEEIPRRKRTKLKVYGKREKPDEKSNVFVEAFNTTKLTSERLSENQVPEENESNSIKDNLKKQKKCRPKFLKTNKKSIKDSTEKFDNALNRSSLLDNNQDRMVLRSCTKSDLPSSSSTIEEFKQPLRFFSRKQNKKPKSDLFSFDMSQKLLGDSKNINDSQNKTIDNNSAQIMNKVENMNISNRSLRSKNNSNISSKITSSTNSSQERSDNELKENFKNNSATQRRSEIVHSWFDTSCIPENIQADQNFAQNSQKKGQKRKSLTISALRDIQNTTPVVNLKRPCIVLQKILLPNSEDYIPIQQIIGKSVKLNSAGTTDIADQSVSKIINNKISKNPPHISDSESTDYQSDLLQSPTPAQSTLKFQGKPMMNLQMYPIPETPVPSKQNKKRRQLISEDEDDAIDVVNNSDEELPPKNISQPCIEESGNTSADDKIVKAFFNQTPRTREQKALQASSLNINSAIWEKMRKKIDTLRVRIEALDKRKQEAQHEQERKKTAIDAKLRRIQALRMAEKKEKRKKPIDKAYYVNGRLYKQPKLPKPKKWVTPRLYSYLWKTMESKFGRKTRIASEKFVLKLSSIYTVIVKRKKYENYVTELNDLLVSMAKLNIIKTRYDFYRFCSDFMPPNFRNKVVPMMLPGNVRNIPYDRELLFKSILSESSSDDDSEENSEVLSESDLESETE